MAPQPARAPSLTRLDLQVDMPKRVFVRGRGLDSEWGGSLLVTGTTATPRIQGELRPLRGRYDFAGKIFELRDGSIQFIGEKEIDPVLDLSAELKTSDLTAIIRVTGTARRPEIEMVSIPDLPQDEILSRVLFNKSTGRLSAAEALRLSQAVATLSGGGGGITDFARRMLSLDVLQFSGGDDEEEGSAQAGKYLSDKVYLGVKAGTTAGSSTATVEIEVTPKIKVEGTVGSSEKSEIGIKWKRDY
jgi:autotransporter translocation and assembly factor TamB